MKRRQFAANGTLMSLGMLSKDRFNNNTLEKYQRSVVKPKQIWKLNIRSSEVSIGDSWGGNVVLNARNEKTLYNVDLSTGKLVWESDIPDKTNDTNREPADLSLSNVKNSSVFVADEHGVIYAVDLNTGNIRWRFDTEHSDISFPDIAGNTVVTLVGDYSKDAELVLAIDSNTGEKKWEFEVKGDPWVRASQQWRDRSSMILVGGMQAYRLNPDTGEIIWTFDPTPESNSQLDVSFPAGGGTIVESEQKIHQVDLKTGEKLWEFNKNNYMHTGWTPSDSAVYLLHSTDGRILSLSINRGEKQWETDVGNAVPVIKSDYGRLLFASTKNTLYAINKQNGEVKWSLSTSSQSKYNIEYEEAGEMIYIADGQQLRQLYPESGEVVWSRNIELDDLRERSGVLIGGGKNAIYAFNAGAEAVGSSSADDTREGENGERANSTESTSQNGRTVQPTAVLRQFTSGGSAPLFGTVAGAAVLGLGAGALKLLRDWTNDADSADHPATKASQTATGGQVELSVPNFGAISTTGSPIPYERLHVQPALFNGTSVWAVTPVPLESETLSTDFASRFEETARTWANLDSHPHLLTVHDAGTDPVPWAVLDPGTKASFRQQMTDLSTNKKITVLHEVCGALHHTYRYGIEYDHLTIESIDYDDGEARLRGLLDQFNDTAQWYSAPEEEGHGSSEQAVIYRIGLIAYELFTGTLPYPEFPDGDPPQRHDRSEFDFSDTIDIPAGLQGPIERALAIDPAERHDSVLHLRDALADAR